jgi:Protein of unknown function (DUF3089)
MKKINTFGLIVIAILLTSIYGCQSSITSPASNSIDYSDSARWLSLPNTTFNVDVFYMYPTSCKINPNTNNPEICAIDDPTMLQGAQSAFQRQATAFSTTCNIYAPYYRQVNTYNNTLTTPTTDAIAAFDYYIKHYNNGRPYILAGHSQGGNVLHNLLADYMKYNPQVYARMVAAYVIGYPITAQFLAQNPHLKFANGPDDTGVIISYNTESSDVNSPNPILFGSVGTVINPINWLRDETQAPVSSGLGSLLPDSTGTLVPVPQCADARIDLAKGVLIANIPLPLKGLISVIDSLLGFPQGVYHSFDYPFYYFNIRENAANRIQHYFKNK